MDRFELSEIKKRIPIIAHLLGDNDCDKILISEVDETLLSYTPTYSGATGSLVGMDVSEVVHFVLDQEVEPFLLDAVKDKGDVHHNEAHCDDEYWEGESIAEAIDRHNVTDIIQCIVVERRGYRIRNHHSVGGHSIKIYLPKSGKQISEYLEARRIAARIQVEEQLSELCI